MAEHRPAIIIVSAIVLIVGVFAVWEFVSSGEEETKLVGETTEATTIQKSVEVSRLSIATSENFARQKIYVISGSLKNLTDKPLRMAEVNMIFTDFDGKKIHEYGQRVLGPKQKPVPPGDVLRFEVRQENLPRGWNYRVPITEVTKLGY